MLQSAGEPAPLVTVRNTFLCTKNPFSKLGLRRCASAEPPSVCDRYAVQLHALMYRQQAVHSPKAQGDGCALEKANSGSHAIGVEVNVKGEPVSPVCSSQESTASEIDGDDRVSEVSQRTSSSGGTSKKSGSAELSNSESQESQDDGSEAAAAEASPDGIEALIKSEGMEALLLRVPVDEAGNATSVGSILHEEGTCKPCVFAHSERKECQNGIQCVFCHFAHAPKRRLRFCKKRRMELKRLADQ